MEDEASESDWPGWSRPPLAQSERALMLTALFGYGLFLFVLSRVASFQLVVKGAYVWVGLLVAAVGNELTEVGSATAPSEPHPGSSAMNRRTKSVGILILLSIAAMAATETYLPVLVVALPHGYWLLALQVTRGVVTWSLLVQVLGLFTLVPLSKHLKTGFYFGGGDTPGHVQSIERVLRHGSSTAILDAYQTFPNLHILGAANSVVTGAPAHDSLFATGVVTFGGALLLMYPFARSLLRTRAAALLATIGFSALVPFVYRTGYFAPQSMGIVLGFGLLYVALRWQATQDRRHFLLSGVLTVALMYTHHFTVVLFAFLLGAAFVARSVLKRIESVTPTGHLPSARHLGVVGTAFVVYWVWIGPGFVWSLGSIAAFFYRQYSETLGLTSSASMSTAGDITTFGTELPSLTTFDAALWLVTPQGVYYAMLAALFALGAGHVWRNQDRLDGALPVVLVGLAGALFLLKTPVVVEGWRRFELGVMFFSAVAIGLGLSRLVTGTISRPHARRVAMVVLVLFATSGQLAAANDVYAVRPDLPDRVTQQHAFEESEYQQLRAIGQFTADRRGTSVYSFWATRLMLDRSVAVERGVADVARKPTVKDESISVGRGLFVYRAEWTNYQVVYKNHRYTAGSLVMSRTWLDRTVAREHKVYTAGEVGALYASENRTYADE
jgi:hypothetical protein